MNVFTNNSSLFNKKPFQSIVDAIVKVRLLKQDNRVNVKYKLQ